MAPRPVIDFQRPVPGRTTMAFSVWRKPIISGAAAGSCLMTALRYWSSTALRHARSQFAPAANAGVEPQNASREHMTARAASSEHRIPSRESRAPSTEYRFVVSFPELRDEGVDLLELEAAWCRRGERAACGPPAVVVFQGLLQNAFARARIDDAGQRVAHRLEGASELHDIVIRRHRPVPRDHGVEVERQHAVER